MKSLRYMLTAAALTLWVCASAQKGLNVAGAFEPRFRDLPGAVETILVNDKVRRVNLSLYHALTLTGHPESAEELERMVARDGAKAVNKEVRYASGHLYYGFYTLPRQGVNRYLFYLNRHLRGGDKIILVYLEGAASPEDVRKLLK
ncbi:MAG: DUF6108 family protein [Muribaculaceae bacterium]|nr:DUF6108 family protein [Muribaculaceae bacterium]